jgi:two-component system, LuxR family, response regulator FixJ
MTKQEQLEHSAVDDGRPLIGIVDDDASFLRSVSRLLCSDGYNVETYSSACEALAFLPAHMPRCLVLDVHMPEMTGFELQERLAEKNLCAPVVFVTAHDTPQTRARANRLGSFGLLLKPFDKEALLRAVKEAAFC